MLIVAISGEDVASVCIKEIYQIVTDAWCLKFGRQ